MIIGIAGRLGAGKTELSKKLLNLGYIKFSFADYLKQIISKLYNIPISDFNNPLYKNTQFSKALPWNSNVANELFSNIIGIKYNHPIYDREFNTIRESMQYIGTDVLQKYDQNFHVKKTIANLDLSENYVCDDIRFMHEFKAMNQLNAHMFYVLSPNNFENVSNHTSEISIKWTDCKYNIINNSPLQEFTQSFMDMFNKLPNYEQKPFPQENNNLYAFYKLDKDNAYIAGLISGCGLFMKVKNGKNTIFVQSKNKYIIRAIQKNCVINDDYCAGIKRFNDYYEYEIISPYIIENLKLWNETITLSKVPMVIEKDEVLSQFWKRGFEEARESALIITSSNNKIYKV